MHGRQAAEALAAATPDFAKQVEQEAAVMPRARPSGSAASKDAGLQLLRTEQKGEERADEDAPAAKRPRGLVSMAKACTFVFWQQGSAGYMTELHVRAGWRGRRPRLGA